MRDGFLPLFLLTTTCIAAPADSLKATFGGGVLGIPWGATLASVVGTYPQGDHVFAVTPGCRAYWVKEGQQFLGIPRDGKGVLLGMDRENHVAIASVAFDFERKVELHWHADFTVRRSSSRNSIGWNNPIRLALARGNDRFRYRVR